MISANQWGIQIDGADGHRQPDRRQLRRHRYQRQRAALGNEINGIILSNNASDNTIGGTGGGQGNTIAYNVQAGVLVQSGTGDSILSNSIVFNGQQGIALAGGNDVQAAPTLTGASGGGTGSNVEGSLDQPGEHQLS